MIIASVQLGGFSLDVRESRIRDQDLIFQSISPTRIQNGRPNEKKCRLAIGSPSTEDLTFYERKTDTKAGNLFLGR